MSQYNESSFQKTDEISNTEKESNIGALILVCIVLALINVILGVI